MESALSAPRSSCASTMRRFWFFSASCPAVPMTSSISRAKLTGSGLSSSLPASIFERSSTSLMRLRRWVPAAFTRRSGSCAFSVPKRAALVTIISVRPMMALSGVRSSWLMLARNCDLRSLASASCRLLSWISSNSRTFSIAITAWSAKVVTQLDLAVGERAHGVARQHKHASRRSFSQERHAKNGVVSADFLVLDHPVFRVGLSIGDMNRSCLKQHATDRTPPSSFPWVRSMMSLRAGEYP